VTCAFDISKSMLNREANSPLYKQIAEVIEEAIAFGELKSGCLLEGEVPLARRLSVSRYTVRQALQQLSLKGLVNRAPGIGTIVQAPMRTGRHNGNFQLVSARREQLHIESVLVCYQIREPTQVEVSELGFVEDVHIVIVKKVHYFEDQLACVSDHRISIKYAPPWEIFPRGSVLGCLRTYGSDIERTSVQVSLIGATDHDADLFGINSSTPILQVNQRSNSVVGDIVEFCDFKIRPELCSLRYDDAVSFAVI